MAMHFDIHRVDTPHNRGKPLATVVQNARLGRVRWKVFAVVLLIVMGWLPGGDSADFCEPCVVSWPVACVCTASGTDYCTVKCRVKTNQLAHLHPLPAHDTTELDLSGNGLTSVEGFTLHQFTGIKVLKLHDNLLENIPWTFLESVPNVEYITLHDNRWHCDCDILPLREWLVKKAEQQTVQNTHTVVCVTPQHLKGRKLTSIRKNTCGDGESTEVFQVWSSRKTHRVKRSETCFDKLEKQGQLIGHCEATNFGSCVTAADGHRYTVHFQDTVTIDVNDATVCHTECQAINYVYSLLYRADDDNLCLCGQEHTDCSECQTIDFTTWEDGYEFCGSIYYLSGAVAAEASIDLSPPYSTNITATFLVSGYNATHGGYYINFGDGYGVRKFSTDLLQYQYFIPASYETSFAVTYGEEPSISLTVLDPPLSAENLVSGLASGTTAVGAVLQQGTRLQVSWERTDPDGTTTQGLYCPEGWTAFRNKCLMTYSVLKEFDEAVDQCELDGAHLLSLADAIELKEFSELVDTTADSGHYTGAELDVDDYVWNGLQTKAYFQNVPLHHEYSTKTHEKYLEHVVIQNGELTTVEQKHEAAFTCEKDPIQCRYGGTFLELTAQCYVVFEEDVLDWQSAARQCSELGEGESNGMLSTVHTEQQHTTLARILNASTGSPSEAWIGLSNQNSAGIWMWEDGFTVSGTDYSAASLPVGGSERCVSLSLGDTGAATWSLETCEQQKAYICQYNAWETVSIQKFVAGSLLSGLNSNITDLEQGESFTVNSTMLYIFPYTMVTQEGMLQSWIFEANHQLEESIDFTFLFFRQLIPADCTDESCDNCTLGQSYCPFSATCLDIIEPCTCQSHPNSTLCTTETRVYKPVAFTTVHLPESSSGLHRIDSIQALRYGDVIGIQIPSTSALPVRCSSEDSEDIRGQSYYVAHKNEWLRHNVTVDMSSADTYHSHCQVMAIYTDPVLVEPPLNILHPAISNYDTDTFKVLVRNSVGSSLIKAQVLIQELEDFRLDHPCQITQNGQNIICAVDKDLNHTLIFSVISLEKEILLRLNVTTEDVTFTTECPDAEDYVCRQPSKGILHYAEWHIKPSEFPGETMSLNATSVTGNTTQNFEFIVHPISKLSNVVLNTSEEIILLGEPAEFMAYVDSSAAVVYTWNISGVVLASEAGSTVNYTFTEAGVQYVDVTAQNPISAVQMVIPVTVFQTAVHKLQFFSELIPGDVEHLAVTMIALLEPYSIGYFEVIMLNTNNLFISFENDNFYQDGKNVSFLYPVETLTAQNISVNVLRPTDNSTVMSFTGEILLIQHLESVDVTSDATIQNTVETNSSTLFNVSHFPVEGTGKVYYRYDFGKWWIPFSSENTTVVHVFNESGVYNVSIQASNNVSTVETVVPFTVVDPLKRLRIGVNKHNFITYEIKIRLRLRQGTMVTYYFNNGTDDNFIRLSENYVKVTYQEAGNYNVTGIAENVFGRLVEWTNVLVHDLEYIELNGIFSDHCLPIFEESTFRASVVYHNPDLLTYGWNIAGDELNVNQIATTYTFNTTGNFTVAVNVSSPSNDTLHYNKTVCVQEPLYDFIITSNVTEIFLTRGTTQSAKVSAFLQQGSNYNIEWSYFDQSVVNNQFEQIIVFDTFGTYEVGVEISNNLGSLRETLSIIVYEKIEGVHVSFNNVTMDERGSLPSGKPVDIALYTDAGSDIEYSWYVESTEGVMIIQPKNTSSYNAANLTVGEYVVHVTARNPVNNVSVAIEISVQDVIQNLSVAAPSNLYVEQETVFTATVLNGSSIQYQWTLETSSPNNVQVLSGDEATLMYTFLSVGWKKLMVEAKNNVSNMTAEIEFIVLNHTVIDMNVNQENSPYIPTETMTIFSVTLPQYMDDASYFWRITDHVIIANSTDKVLNYTFHNTTEFTIEFEATQGYYFIQSTMVVYVQEVIENVTVTLEDVIDNKFNIYDNITMRVHTEKGSDVMVVWDMGNGYSVAGQDVISYMYKSSGIYVINVTVSNNVSEVITTVVVEVLDKIAGLELLYCCEEAVRTNTKILLHASTRTGTPVYFNWTVHDNPIKEFEGQNITYVFKEPGNYSVVVTAMNGYSQDTYYAILVVLDPITDVEVVSDISLWKLYFYEDTGLNITFTAQPVGGEDTAIMYDWTINETSYQIGPHNIFGHHFAEGIYRVEVQVWNGVSNLTKAVRLFRVRELQCAPPVLTLTGKSERQVLKSLSLKVEVSVESCIRYETEHHWYIYKSSCEGGQQVELPINSGFLTPSLSLPARTLDYGRYCFNMTSMYVRTSAYSSIQLMVDIYDTPLKALIVGGSRRIMPSNETIYLDGTVSYDPDNISTRMMYIWTCSSSKALAGSDFEVDPSESFAHSGIDQSVVIDNCFNSSIDRVLVIPANSLALDRLYNFTLTVYAENRTSTSVSQLIRVRISVVEVSIECPSCRENNMYAVGNGQLVKLLGSCPVCASEALYFWTVLSKTTNTSVPLNENTTNSGANKPVLSVKKGVLSDDIYTFSLRVITSTIREGLAVLDLTANHPPTGGHCSLRIDKPYVVAMVDMVEISCQNWVDDNQTDSQLIYHIYAQKRSVSLEWYPIYRGTNSNNTFYLSGTEELDLVDLYVQVINAQAAEARGLNVTVEVRAPSHENKSRTAYLLELGSTQLSALRFQNRPKPLLQYVIALNLQLNAESEKSLDNDVDTGTRILLRRDMILIMNDVLTVSTIDDVQQMAYALMLITTYTDEFPVTQDIYISVIQLLNLMIMPLTNEVSPGMTGEEFMPLCILAAADNLLHIISSHPTLNATSYQRLSEELQSLIETTLLLKLQTQLVEENPSEYATERILAKVQHVYAKSVSGKYEFGNGDSIQFPEDFLEYMGRQEIYQSVISYSNNPNTWGLPNGVPITSKIHNSYLTNTTESKLNISGLTESIVIEFGSAASETPVNRKKRSITETTADTDTLAIEVGPGESQSTPINVTENLATGSVLHMKFEATIEGSNDQDLFVSLYLAKGHVATVEQHDFNMDILVNGDDNYTIFLADNLSSSEVSDMYFLTLYNPSTERSINTSIQHYVTSCQYYSPAQAKWDNTGCSVRAAFTPGVTVCNCTHLAMFGATYTAAPAELKFEALYVRSISPVIYIVASVGAILYVVLALVLRHLDKVDLRSIKYVPLCGKDGEFKYEVTVVTGRRYGAGTSSNVGIKLIGKSGKSDNKYLEKPYSFQRSCTDTVLIAMQRDLGDIQKLLIWHDNTGLDASWYVCRVIVRDLQNNNKYYFLVNSWLSVVKDTNSKPGYEIQREVTTADERVLRSFHTRFSEELWKGAVERHLWVSMLEKPARNYFSRVQRLTCCTTMLCCYMLLNALWYGLTHSAVDYKYVSRAGYFVWNDVAVGAITCIAVFLPVILIVQLFRHSRPRENSNKIGSKPDTAQSVLIDVDIEGDNESIKYRPNRRTIHLPLNLSREGSEESSFTVPPKRAGILKRTENIHRVAPMMTEPKKSQGLPVHNAGNSALWTNENIIKSWPEKIPSHMDSRQPSAVSVRNTRRIDVENADELIQDLDNFNESLSKPKHRREHSALMHSRTREPSVVNLSMGSMIDMDNYYVTSRDTTSVSFASNCRNRKISHISSNSEEAESMPDIAEVAPSPITAPIVPMYGPNHHILVENEETTGVQYLPLPPPVRRHCFIPYGCVYFAYILCAVLCLASIITVFIVATNFGDAISLKWLLATFVSWIFSFLIIEPLKLVIVATVMALLSSHLEESEDQLYYPPILLSNEKLKDTKVKPIGGYSLLHAKEEGKKIRRIKTLIRQFIAYTFFLFLVLLLNYTSYNRSAYYYTSHVKNTFTKQLFSNIRTYDQYWGWLSEVAGPNFHNWYENREVVSGYNVGVVRLRQIRSGIKHCSAKNAFKDSTMDNLVSQSCYGDPSWTEDKAMYGLSWEPALDNGSRWLYSSADRLPVHGHMAKYGGGGYIQLPLGQTINQTRDNIDTLKLQDWLNRGTRAVFLEWTEYSVGSPLFVAGSLLVEFPISGGAIPTVSVQAAEVLNFAGQVNVYMLCEIFLSIVFVYLFTVAILNIKADRSGYFKEFWNWTDLVIMILTLTSVAMYIHATVHCEKVFNSFLDNKEQFTSFEDVTHWITTWRIINAVLLFFLMFVVMYQVRFIRFMSKFTRTIHTASWKILAIAFFFLAFLCFYSQLGYLWYGHLVYVFHEVGLGVPGMLSIFRGSTDFFDTMWRDNRAFTLIFLMSFLALMFICVFGLVLAVVQDSYKAIKAQMMYHSTLETQDYEMVELLIDRFKRWTGMKKEKPAFRRVKFLGEPSISSRNSSAKTLRSHSQHSSEVSSEPYSIVDEEMEQMNRAKDLERVQVSWENMLMKLDQVVSQDREETQIVKKIESQLQCRSCAAPPKQPKQVSNPSLSPFKDVRPRVKPSTFPFNIPQIVEQPEKDLENHGGGMFHPRGRGTTRVESARQPLVPPVNRGTRQASSARRSLGPEEGSAQSGEPGGKLRRHSTVLSHAATVKADPEVRHVWEDT